MVLEAGGLVYSTDDAAGHVGAVVHPWEVSVAREAPADSALNHVTAPISSLVPSGNRVRVRWAPHRGVAAPRPASRPRAGRDRRRLVQGDRDPTYCLSPDGSRPRQSLRSGQTTGAETPSRPYMRIASRYRRYMSLQERTASERLRGERALRPRDSRPRRSWSTGPKAPASGTSTGKATSTSPVASGATTRGTGCRPPSRPSTSRRTATFTSASSSACTSRTSTCAAALPSSPVPWRGAEDAARQLRRRGARERRQDRARLHRPPGRRRVRARLPRTHAAHDDDDEQARLQEGHGAVRPEVYRAPGPIRTAASTPRRRFAASKRSSRATSTRVGRLRRARAGTGRGRVHRDAGGLSGSAAGGVRPARDPLRRRRGAVGHRPHRPGLRDRALRSRARPDDDRQVDRGRAASGRRHRTCGGHGRRASRRPRGTFGGNPVSCAAAAAVLETVSSAEFRARSEELGTRIRRRLDEIAGRVHRRRGTRPRLDARSRARRGPPDQGPCERPRLGNRRGSARARPGPARVRPLLERHPHPRSDRDRRRGSLRASTSSRSRSSAPRAEASSPGPAGQAPGPAVA